MRHHGCQQQLTCCQSAASHATGREDLPSWPPSPACGQDSQQHLQKEKLEDPQTFPTNLSSLRPSPYKHTGSQPKVQGQNNPLV